MSNQRAGQCASRYQGVQCELGADHAGKHVAEAPDEDGPYTVYWKDSDVER